MRIARITSDKLGRRFRHYLVGRGVPIGICGNVPNSRLLPILRTTTLSLGIIRVSRNHCIELLPLHSRHPIHLFMEVLCPLLLILDDLLTRVTVHIGLS